MDANADGDLQVAICFYAEQQRVETSCRGVNTHRCHDE
jgi:hypothetical protein